MKAGTVLTHSAAALALFFAIRTPRVLDGWEIIESVDAETPFVSLIVPARNEERSIEACVRSLLAQRLDDFEVIVVDDRSDDATASILARIAAGDDRLRVVRGEPLPDGWIGKPWACAQGARIARGEWLVFTDADSVHEPQATASVFAFARRRGVDAVSLGTAQVTITLAERAVLPTILGMLIFVTGPFSAINDPLNVDRALANGQYIAVSRRAYDALGGHETLKAQIVEDVEFARLIKRDGRFRMLLAGGEALVRVRMYHSFREIWDGFTKNIFMGANGNVVGLTSFALLLALLGAAPPVLAINAVVKRRPFEAGEAVATTIAVIATEWWALDRTLSSRRLAWYAPVGMAVMAAITLNSTFRVLSGQGVMWRGRRYSGRPDSSN